MGLQKPKEEGKKRRYDTRKLPYTYVAKKNIHKQWESTMNKIFDQDRIDWLIMNDLPLDEEFDKLLNKHDPATRKQHKKPGPKKKD